MQPPLAIPQLKLPPQTLVLEPPFCLGAPRALYLAVASSRYHRSICLAARTLGVDNDPVIVSTADETLCRTSPWTSTPQTLSRTVMSRSRSSPSPPVTRALCRNQRGLASATGSSSLRLASRQLPKISEPSMHKGSRTMEPRCKIGSLQSTS
jgi:hypothetical protein